MLELFWDYDSYRNSEINHVFRSEKWIWLRNWSTGWGPPQSCQASLSIIQPQPEQWSLLEGLLDQLDKLTWPTWSFRMAISANYWGGSLAEKVGILCSSIALATAAVPAQCMLKISMEQQNRQFVIVHDDSIYINPDHWFNDNNIQYLQPVWYLNNGGISGKYHLVCNTLLSSRMGHPSDLVLTI